MDKISIVLCTYNGARFLPEQLNSFLLQTRLPDELVINDDCSTDGTIKIIEDFSKKAPFPVHLKINEKNLGSSKNFDLAISRSSGDIVFLADQDDFWFHGKISLIEKEFAADPDTALIFTNAELVDENLQSLGKYLFDFTLPETTRKRLLEGRIFEILLNQNVVTGATMAFRSKFRKSFLPIPYNIPNLIHDGWIALIIAACAHIKFLDEPLIKYRQHVNQQLGVELLGKRKIYQVGRQKCYYDSICFLTDDIIRLTKMKEVFKDYRDIVLIDELIKEKGQIIKHYQVRMTLPETRRHRLIPILNEIASGRYKQISRGLLSAAKDFIEK